MQKDKLIQKTLEKKDVSQNKENKILPQETSQGKGDITDSKESQSDTAENNESCNSTQDRNSKSPTLIDNSSIDKTTQDDDSNNVHGLKLKLDLQDSTYKNDIVDAVKTRSTSVPLSPVSEVLKSVATEESNLVDREAGNDVESETPAPVAPPRRKRKKKPEPKESLDKPVEDSKVFVLYFLRRFLFSWFARKL